MTDLPVVDAEFVQGPLTVDIGRLVVENLDAARREREQRSEDLAQPLPSQVERKDLLIQRQRRDESSLLLRLHIPRTKSTAVPALLWIHGGGYVLGGIESDDSYLARWAETLECVTVALEYRIAPEHPFPAALEDCNQALQWTFANSAKLKIDSTRIGVGGSSAGGGLAAALSLYNLDRQGPQVQFQLLKYPMLDDRQGTISSHWEAPGWPPIANAFGWKSYLGDLYGTEGVPAYAAPARREKLDGLPSTYIMVGSADGFFDEDLEYAKRLCHAGIPTDLHVYAGAPHGFDRACPDSAISKRSEDDIVNWLKRIWEQ